MSNDKPKYEIKTGPLAETYGLFNPLTINTGAELSADRIRIQIVFNALRKNLGSR